MKVLAFEVMLLAVYASADIFSALDKAPLVKQEQAGDLTGIYTVKGQETGGKGYGGICVVSRKSEVYLFQWMVGTSGSAFTGIGVRQGDVIAVAWALPTEKGIARGVNVYRIESKKLTGRWASMPGTGALQTEVLTWLKDVEEDE